MLFHAMSRALRGAGRRVTGTGGAMCGLLGGGGLAASAASCRTVSSTAAASAAAPALALEYEPEWRRFAVEMGTGTSLRRQDHTAAAVRAMQDALWKVSLTAYRALDMEGDQMKVEVVIGVPKPDEVDTAQVLAVLPYGERSIKVVQGGLAIDGGCGADAQGQIIMANAAVIVSLDVGGYLAIMRDLKAKAAAAAEDLEEEEPWVSPTGNKMTAAEADAILEKHFK